MLKLIFLLCNLPAEASFCKNWPWLTKAKTRAVSVYWHNLTKASIFAFTTLTINRRLWNVTKIGFFAVPEIRVHTFLDSTPSTWDTLLQIIPFFQESCQCRWSSDKFWWVVASMEANCWCHQRKACLFGYLPWCCQGLTSAKTGALFEKSQEVVHDMATKNWDQVPF